MVQLKKLSEISKFAVPVLAACSCIQLMTYYYYWNIPILDYLSVSELIFQFIKPLLTIILLAVIYISFNLLFAVGVALYVKWDSSRKKKAAPKAETSGPLQSSETKKPGKSVIAMWVFIGFTLIVAVGLFVEGIWFDYDVIPVVILHVLLWALAVLLAKNFLLKSRDGKLSLESFFAGTMIMLISASFFYGRYQAHFAESNPVSHRIVLADGSKIESDSNLIYLGKTSSYYFFYDKAKSQSSIIPVGEAKRTDIMGRAPILTTESQTGSQIPASPQSRKE